MEAVKNRTGWVVSGGTVLGCRVMQVNDTHKKLNELFRKLIPVLSEFHGRKIVKADGGLMKAFRDALDCVFTEEERGLYSARITPSYSSVRIEVKTCYQWYSVDGRSDKVFYYEAAAWIGNLTTWATNPGVFSYMQGSYEPHREDFTEECVAETREKIEQIESELSKLKSWRSLGPFDMYDR